MSTRGTKGDKRDVYGDRRARVDCLKAAVETRTPGEPVAAILERAERYFRFIQGGKPLISGLDNLDGEKVTVLADGKGRAA